MPRAEGGEPPVSAAGLVRRIAARLIDTALCAGAIGLAVLAGADTTKWTVVGILLGAVFAYEVVAVARWGTTVGKLLLGLRVLRFHGGSNPGSGRATGRVGAYWLIGAIPCGIGPLILLVTTATDHSGWRRGWHDRAAGTVVVELARQRPEIDG